MSHIIWLILWFEEISCQRSPGTINIFQNLTRFFQNGIQDTVSLRLVQTPSILFSKSISEGAVLSRSRNSSLNFRDVVCRIRLFPTLISKRSEVQTLNYPSVNDHQIRHWRDFQRHFKIWMVIFGIWKRFCPIIQVSKLIFQRLKPNQFQKWIIIL